MKMFKLCCLSLIILLAGCQSAGEASKSSYILIDISGTYFKQLKKCTQAAKFALIKSQTNDFIAVAKISSRSFSNEEVIIKGTLPSRPSQANSMKTMMASKIDTFAKHARPSNHTDISGAIYQAAQTLGAQPSLTKNIVIFSDMVEDLNVDTIRGRMPDLTGIHVIATNVIKLRSDNRNPEKYFKRLKQWEELTLGAGAASWKVVDDPMQLADYL
ncbi:MAG: hypothetical protein Q9M19_08710 [Mariprofundaceae bacterium]|nr:hypothetical protein [Mariprofundaceae bacterium]